MNRREHPYIELKGVRVNNLKDISLQIPRNKLIAVTGLSGSGKSSLAFDTLYAEGQRRYVESLSVYARQFVNKMSKPEADLITGIPPAIAIEQRKFSKNQRSTVGTTTEVYDYLRMLFARIGRTISPISGKEVRRHTTKDVVDFVNTLPKGTRYMICAPMVVPRGRPLADHLHLQLENGYARILRDGEVLRIQELLEQKSVNKLKKSGMSLVVDRLMVDPDNDATNSRLGDSVESAFFEGKGELSIVTTEGETFPFSDRFEADGITFEEPTDKLFSFNNSVGACPTCEGYGMVLGIDEDLVIQNKSLSLYEECVMPWRGPKMSQFRKDFVRASEPLGFPIHRPYKELTEAEQNLLWYGDEEHGVRGIYDFFREIEWMQYKMHFRIMLARYRGRSRCPECKGKRLRKEALYVKVGGKDIAQLVAMSITELRQWLEALTLEPAEEKVGGILLEELRKRVGLLDKIGLGYLTLDRVAGTLSGGEGQRIQLATSLGGGLLGTLYILDEPSIGLHSRDTHLLIDIMRQLTDMGNTVVVVEHDEEVMKAADLILDFGPKAGELGGEVMYYGSPQNLPDHSNSYTIEYLTHRMEVPWPTIRRQPTHFITVKQAYKNNLQGITVHFPLQCISVVTGVSGSGKSTLVRDVLYENLQKQLAGMDKTPQYCDAIEGVEEQLVEVRYVDQDSLSTSSRSNPIIYVGAYDYIRRLMAEQPLAVQMGYTSQYFSFNTDGGRCEECEGEGMITVEMQFMADMKIPCEECHGKRFKDEILEVEYHGKNIYDILNLTVSDALSFFMKYSEESPVIPRIIEGLRALGEVGLEYIRLGQSSSTLSGGENQRVKLAAHLVSKNVEQTLFIFDEPTTGLHTHDINVLMRAFNKLVNKGHTIIIVEHNLDVIKSADYVIDLGPDGGAGGGELLFEGSPMDLMEVTNSYTAHYLKEKWAEHHP